MINSKQGVQPGTGRWTELVSEAKARDAARNWYLGDAALEIAPMGDDHGRNGGYENLEKFAEEVGLPFASIREYRRVASMWPHDKRLSSTSWTAHSMLTARPELIRPGMTVTEVYEALGRSVNSRRHPEEDSETKVQKVTEYLEDPEVREDARIAAAASEVVARQAPERRAEQARAALRDPEVRREVVRDRGLARDLGESSNEVAKERLAAAGLRRMPEDPVEVSFGAEAQATSEIQRAQNAVRAASRALRGVALEEDGRRVLSSATTMLGQLVDGLQRQIDGIDMDAELSALLARE